MRFVVAILATFTCGCSMRSCARMGVVSHEVEVASLAREQGFGLVVNDCADAMRGGSTMEGVFTCLATLDPAQKQKVVAGFHLAPERPPPPGAARVPKYTPTDNFTCIARFDLSFQTKRSEIEILIADEGSVPGMQSVELHIAPTGAACLEFVRTR